MAVKYTSEFKSTRGAHYRVTIDDSSYAGTSPIEIPMAPPGFTIDYDGGTTDRYQWVIGSTATLYYLATSSDHIALLDQIVGSTEGRFRIRIEQNNGGWATRWVGVVLAEQLETEDIDYPQPFSITASDDLANLKEVDYNSGGGTPYTGSATIAEHFANCISKLRTLSLLESTVVRIEEAWMSNQQSGTGYHRIGVRHPAFYADTDSPYTLEFLSTYEVLEQLCSSFGLRFFHQNGQFVAQSISRVADEPNSIDYTDVDAAGNASQTSITRPNAETDANGFTRIRGWRNSYLNPLRRVERRHNVGAGLFFAGTQYYEGTSTGSGDGTGLLDGTVSVAPIDATDYLNPGDPVSFTFKLALARHAVAFSGDERVLPFRVSAQVRIGNQYLNRPVTFFGDYETPLISGGFVNVASYTYGPATWTTDPNSRVEFMTPPQQMTVDGTSITSFGLSAEGLPATFTGDTISWSFTCDAIDKDGDVYANAENAFNYATNDIQQVGVVRIYVAQTYLMEGAVATYRAENQTANGGRVTFDTGETKIGDNIGPETQDHTYVLDASDNEVTTENWKRIGETESLELAALLCREVLKGQTKTIRIQRGSLVDETEDAGTWAFTMEHTLTHKGTKYLPFNLSIDAHADRYSAEWFQVTSNALDATVPGIEWTQPIDDPASDTVAFESAQVLTTTQGGTIQDQQTKLQYISVTQAVDLDNVESQTNTNTTDIGTLETGLASTQSKLELIYKTFSPKGDDYGNTTVKYQQDKLDGMQMSLAATSTALQSGSGNTAINLSENSPGIFQVDLQDETTPGASTTAIYAVGRSTGSSIGINTTNPRRELDVVGRASISGVLTVEGDTDVPNLDVAQLIRFALDQELTPTAGQIAYDFDRATFYLGIGATAVDVADDPWIARNNTGSTIAKGTPVYVTGTLGASGRKTIGKMIADGSIDARYFLGVTAADIDDGEDGVVLDRGTIRGFNTSSLSGVLYVSDTTAGTWTTTAPASPSQALAAAFVINAATNGTIAVRVAPDENASGGGGGDAFGTIAVAGQSDVVADGSEDTVTFVAGTNLAITTDAATDTVTFTPSATPTFTSIITNSTISAAGAITTLSGLTVGGTTALMGPVTTQNTLTVGSTLIAQGISFTGGSTSTIGIATGLPNQPDDLQLLSNGNVTVVLDYDSDEAAQAFIVKNQAGTVIFQVDEDGVTSGLLTTATPTTSGLPTSVQQGNPITGTITNYDSSKVYVAKIYDSTGTEQTSNPVTVGAGGAISALAPATVGTGYELRIFAATPGQLKSPDDITTFEVTPSRTFTHWRFTPVDVNGDPTTTRVFLIDISIYTGANATGTGYPTTNATSNTSISGVTISAGYEVSSSYSPWKAFDSNLTSSGWWTISVPNTSVHWIQVEFDTAITAASVRLIEWQNFNYNPYVKVLGSNTGAFAGEEVDCGTFTTLSDSTYGSTAVTHILNI